LHGPEPLAEIQTPPIITTDFLYLRFIRDRSIQEKDFGRIPSSPGSSQPSGSGGAGEESGGSGSVIGGGGDIGSGGGGGEGE